VAKAATKDVLVLRGPPERLEAPLPGVGLEATAEVPEVELPVAVLSARVRRLPPTDLVVLRVKVSATAPGGRHEGTVKIGKSKLAIVAEVDERPGLRVFPDTIELAVDPGGTATKPLQFMNVGNVPAQLPSGPAFGLFDVRGVDRSLGRTWRSDARGRDRLDVLADELAASHGGLVSVDPGKGAALKPGELREVQMTFSFESELEPGHRYAGRWALPGSDVAVRVQVSQAREVK
jgi:hypothetical protein